jgi:hypothetical protein
MATFGTPFTKYFTDLNGISKYNSSNNPGSAGDTYSSAGVKQSPRLTQNVTLQSTPGSPGGKNSAVRCWTRPAPTAEGSTPANWWSTSGFSVDGGRQKLGKWEFAVRRQEGLNTKGVWLMWPIGPNKNGWLNAPPNSANEFDIIEWFDQAAAGGVATAGCNIHYRKADGTVAASYQKQIPHPLIPGVDWVNWHVVEFITLPNQTDMLIDGVRAAQFPLTNPLFLQKVQMYFAMQMALLIDPGLTRGTTSRETAWMDMAYLKVYPLADANQDAAPSVPANLAANPTSETSAHYTWGASVDQDPLSPVKDYPLERALVTGGVVGPYSQIATPVPTSYQDNVLNAGKTYSVRVSARDTLNLQSDPSDPVQFATPATPPAQVLKAKLVITGVDDPTITSENGAIITTAPFNGLVNPRNSTGPISRVDIDYGNGSTYPGVTMPAAPGVTNTWPDAGEVTVTLTVWGTDPGTGIIPSDQDTVTLRLADPTQLDSSPNFGWHLPRRGEAIRAQDWYDFLMSLDDQLNQTAMKDGVYQTADDIVIAGTIAGDGYRRVKLTADGRFFEGDGSYPTDSNAPLLGPGGSLTGSAPPPPASTDIQFSWSADPFDSGSGTVSTVPLVFPTSVPTGYALAWVHMRRGDTTPVTPSGWTLLGDDKNGNGNSRLLIFGKLCGSGDNGATLNVALGGAAAAVGVLVGYVGNATTGTIVASSAVKNSSSAVNNHPVPNLATTTQTNQMAVCGVGVRYSTQPPTNTPDAPATVTARQQAVTSQTTQTNVALTVGDRKITTTGQAVALDPFHTNTGAFSVGGTVLLSHA